MRCTGATTHQSSCRRLTSSSPLLSLLLFLFPLLLALPRCDPPCIPYLGIYLSDLTFIDEGTPNFTDSGLLNFAKMRMIAHVIREVRQFQQTPYKIEPIQKAAAYLLDPALRLSDDELYQRSLMIEPRSSRLSVSYPPSQGPLCSPRLG